MEIKLTPEEAALVRVSIYYALKELDPRHESPLADVLVGVAERIANHEMVDEAGQ